MCCIRPIARFRSTITMRWRTITLVWRSSIASTIDWQLKDVSDEVFEDIYLVYLLILDKCGTS